MWIILGVLAAGVVIGLAVRLSAGHIKIAQRLQQVGVIVVLFCMGVGIGGNKELVDNIQSLGLKAATFAFFTIVCSVLLVYVVTRKWGKGESVK